MRLGILDHGYGLGPKLLFQLIRLFSGHPATQKFDQLADPGRTVR